MGKLPLGIQQGRRAGHLETSAFVEKNPVYFFLQGAGWMCRKMRRIFEQDKKIKKAITFTTTLKLRLADHRHASLRGTISEFSVEWKLNPVDN